MPPFWIQFLLSCLCVEYLRKQTKRFPEISLCGYNFHPQNKKKLPSMENLMVRKSNLDYEPEII